MAWELIFMLLLLKIPLFYLCGVVWWAVKAEPTLDEPPGDAALVRAPLAPNPLPHGPRPAERSRFARRMPPLRPVRRAGARRTSLARTGARR